MNSARVQAISEWCNHLSKIYQDIQVFIEFCNFYWHFIYNFSGIVWFLHQLLHDMKNDKKPGFITDNWQEPQQEIFEQLIDAFISASVLCHYDSNCKLRVKTDVSESVYVSILFQKWEDEWHSIAYFLKRFSEPELSYSIHDKKLMTIIMSFRQWRHYLKNISEIKIWSDHENLKQFMIQIA